MFTYIVVGFVALWIVAAIAGVGKNTVFRDPRSMTDAQIERTIRLCARIMDNSRIGSKEWSESGAKHDAAFREQCRRRGMCVPSSRFNQQQPEDADDD